MRHARDYSQDIYYYSRGAQRIEPQVAKAESEQLGKNIDAVKKELAVVRTESAADKETLAALEAIEKHLTKAVETHKMLHAESSRDSVEGGICAKCCSEITKALEMAMAEHDALRRTLELRTQDESTRVDGSPDPLRDVVVDLAIIDGRWSA
jgi:hypothetical protein